MGLIKPGPAPAGVGADGRIGWCVRRCRRADRASGISEEPELLREETVITAIRYEQLERLCDYGWGYSTIGCASVDETGSLFFGMSVGVPNP